jgi:hypothetical protein
MKLLLYTIVLATLLCGGALPLAAQPSLQLYIENATYDWSTQSWFITAPGELKLWVVGNTGADGPIREVKLIAFHPAEETGSILLIPITTSLLPDPSVPPAPVLAGSGAGSVPLSHGSGILPPHGVVDSGKAWKAFALGDLTQTDSPVGDFIYSFPASFPSRGQLNAYRVLVDGYTSLHFDAVGTVTRGHGHNQQTCFAPFSHDAGARLTPRRIHFGMTEPWSKADLPETLDLGFEIVRDFIEWGLVQPVPGQPFAWAAVDGVVRNYHSLGFELLLLLVPDAQWDQACWSSTVNLSPPCDPAAWQAFVRAIVERYNGDGIADMPGLQRGVRFWEMFNEPSGSSYSAWQYVQFLATTYSAIKAVCPNCRALQAGDGPDAYTETVFSLGGAAYFDIANAHAIQAATFFDNTLAAAGFTQLMLKYHVLKPLWITEVQIESGPGAAYPYFTEEQGGAEMVKAYVRAFGLGAERIFYTVVRQNPALSPNVNRAALIESTGRKRPSYFAMRTMISQLKGFDSVVNLSSNSAVGRYRFTIAGSSVYVLWGSGPLPPEIQGTLRVVKIDGSQSIQQASTLTLSSEPVFVIRL